MSLSVLLGQIPLSPPLKKVSVDEWWQRRQRAGVSPRVERMMRESHDAWLGERSEAAESGPTGGDESVPPRAPESRPPEPGPPGPHPPESRPPAG